MNDTILNERIALFAPSYQEFVTSDFAQQAAQQFGSTAGLNEQQQLVYENAIMLFLLAFMDMEQFTTFIRTECEVAEQDAQVLAGSVVASLPPDFIQAHAKLINELEVLSSTPHTHTPEPVPGADTLANEISEAESALRAIPKVRTMADDVQKSQANETTHSSSQSSLLDKSKRPTPPAA